MRPFEAFEDAAARSFAAAAFGFLIGGCLHAVGAFNQSILVLCTVQAFLFGSLALLLGYYHKRWALGSIGAAFAVLLPYVVNLLWVRFSTTSLVYPVAALTLVSGFTLGMVHNRIAGPQPEDDAEEQIIRAMMEKWESNVTWKDRVTWLCITASIVIVLVLLLR